MVDPTYYILVPVCFAIFANFFVDLGIAVIGVSIFTKFATGVYLGTNMASYQEEIESSGGKTSSRELLSRARSDFDNPLAKRIVRVSKSDTLATVFMLIAVIVTYGVHHG